jgi:DNA repair exonuclease SbcCD ATPase subunit
MKLLSLIAHNIFSIGHAELKLSDRGLLLVTGHSYDEGSANGAGKSSVANKAISWGLYGQTFGGSRADAVINSHNPDEVSFVTIEFVGVDGQDYEVSRSRNPAKLVFWGETSLTQRNEKDTQLLINKALGKDFKIFSHTDFFGQGRNESFFSLAPAEQKQIVENILPIDKLSTWADYSKEIRKKLGVNRLAVQEKKIKNDAWYDSLTQQKINLQNNHINWQAQHEIKLKGTRENIKRAKQEQSVTNNKIQAVDAELSKAIATIPADKDSLLASIDEHKNTIEIATKNLNDAEKTIASYGARTDFLKAQFRELKFDGICTVCYQQVSPEVTKKKQEELEASIYGAEFNKAVHKADFDIKSDEIKVLKEDLANKIYVLGIVNRWMDNIQELRNKLAILGTNQHEQMVSIYEDNLKALESEINPYKELLESILKQVLKQKAVSTETDDKLKELDKEIETVRVWEDGFLYEIKNMMIEQACPFLEDRTNVYLDKLNNPQIRSTFSTVKLLKSGESRDEFNVEVKSSTGGQEFDLFSGGEQQLTSFACGMALADLASSQAEGSSEILILDEPFTGLSAMNCENIINFLTQHLTDRKSTILLISNEDELKSRIPQSVYIVKRNGISSIEV